MFPQLGGKGSSGPMKVHDRVSRLSAEKPFVLLGLAVLEGRVFSAQAFACRRLTFPLQIQAWLGSFGAHEAVELHFHQSPSAREWRAGLLIASGVEPPTCHCYQASPHGEVGQK